MSEQGYSLSEVSKLLGLSRSIVTGLIDAGFVSPARGRRKEYRFTFQDLVMLRAARGLTEAGLSSTRILRSLRRLKSQLPHEIPRGPLRIEAQGDAVVVSEGDRQWQPEDGQYVLGFTVESTPRRGVSFIDQPSAESAPAVPRSAPAASPAPTGDEWFRRAMSLEEEDPEASCNAYRQAIAVDPKYGPAYTNLGRMLHQQGRLREAESIYRLGLARCGADSVSLFNLGVLLEDSNRSAEAAGLYRKALEASPEMADAHYNLALLCEAKGMRREALRHLSAYRKFSG
ncbi:MAG TPA: tetratricopeptide repeat protein [Casimicrobiaceae bacterium]|nr:tetratricopeptide repeat protein [Casimicrobiaceae bacterium]